MKVTICHHFSLTYFAGGEKFSLSLARSLTQPGFKVNICSLPFGRKNDVESIQSLKGIDYEEKWHDNVDADIAYFLYAPFISKLFRCTCPKIASIHAFALAPELQDKNALPKNPFKFLRAHGILPTAAYYSRFLMNSELKSFDAVHLINPNMTIKHKRVFTIPLWVDTESYRPTREKDAIFTVLFVGRRTWRKGSDIFLKAAEITKRRDSRIRFVVAGRGDDRAGKDFVEDLGFIRGERLRDIYSSAHVVIAPSRVDICSLVMLESLACGTPVIASDIPAHRLPHLPLVYASTAEEIVKQVDALHDLYIRDPKEYLKLTKKARKSVEEFYSTKVLLPRFRNMLTTVYKKAWS